MVSHGVDLEIAGLTKRYGNLPVVDDVDLTISAGEFMTLLGPSGSGKTTTLNLIAGFAQPDAGRIALGGRPLVGVPPHRRDIGVVFQNYALFPHMTVGANVAFPLKQRRMGKPEITRAVGDILQIVGLGDLSNRYPRELSGGQQQRVALARALVFGPKLLLLDEPLGALDKRLREGLQLEIKRIHREIGVTFVFVTHDQEEALTMSDRIAVFNHGRIEQVSDARDLYEQPQTLFAAQFLGDSNVVQGTVSSVGGQRRIEADGLTLIAPATSLADGANAALVLRPERVRVEPAGSPVAATSNVVYATVKDLVYLGGRRRLVLHVAGREFIADQMASPRDFSLGESVVLSWDPSAATLVEGGTDRESAPTASPPVTALT